MSNELATTPQNPFSILTPELLQSLDVDKMERVFALQERLAANNAEQALARSLADFQKEVPAIKKERKSNNSQYASLDDIMFSIREPLSKHGLSISFDTETTETSLKAVCHVIHTGGARFSREMTVPIDKGMRGANVTQQLGSASSYARRYALVNSLNLVITDQDDDGGGTSPTITEDQANEIHQLMEPLDAGRRKSALEWIGAEKVEDIKSSDFTKFTKQLQKATR